MGFLLRLLVLAICHTLGLAKATAVDPYIICSGSTPDADANWPNNYSPAQYDYNNMNLCSGVYGLKSTAGNSRNLGCQCQEESGPLQCGILPADRRLIARRVQTDSNIIFPSWCMTNCICSTAEKVHDYAVAGQRAHGVFSNSTLPTALIDIDVVTTPLLPSAKDTSEIDPSNARSVNSTCGAPSCTATSDCASILECNNCLLASTVIPGGPTVQYSGYCGVVAGFTNSASDPISGPFSGWGKREEQRPACVCNTTYVILFVSSLFECLKRINASQICFARLLRLGRRSRMGASWSQTRGADTRLTALMTRKLHISHTRDERHNRDTEQLEEH